MDPVSAGRPITDGWRLMFGHVWKPIARRLRCQANRLAGAVYAHQVPVQGKPKDGHRTSKVRTGSTGAQANSCQ